MKWARPCAAAASARPQPGSAEFLLDLYRRMPLIRNFEERVRYLFLEGVMPGWSEFLQGVNQGRYFGLVPGLRSSTPLHSQLSGKGHAESPGY
jgi:hypothetical protein